MTDTNFNKFPQDRKVILTKHAIERAKEIEDTIEIKKIVWLIYQSTNDVDRRFIDEEYKLLKYGEDQRSVTYWRNGDYIFTILDTVDRMKLVPIYLVLTVASQRKRLPRP